MNPQRERAAAPEAPRLRSQRARKKRPRDWHGYGGYQRTHRAYMDSLIESGIVHADGLAFSEDRNASGRIMRAWLRGRVLTASGAVLSVSKQFEARYQGGRARVRTLEYRYHAWLPGPPQRDLFRYDNCHGGLDTLHRHSYRADGSELPQEMIEHDYLPTLNVVIEETDEFGAMAAER